MKDKLKNIYKEKGEVAVNDLACALKGWVQGFRELIKKPLSLILERKSKFRFCFEDDAVGCLDQRNMKY